MANEKDTIAKAPRGRPTRKSVGVRSRLGVTNKDPNFEYRIVTDKDGRVDQFREAGWELATGDETVGVSRLSQPSAEGSVKQVHVGNGDKGVLMKIRKDWYEEDQQAKAEFVNEKENATLNHREDGQYGSIRTKVSQYG